MKTRRVIFILLSVIVGAFFIFSAYSKTQPIQYFETTISSQLHVSDTLASIAARFFIGLEAALGILLMLQVTGYRKWVLKVCLILLIVFSIHLVFLLIFVGNDINCGCMGSLAPMSPGWSLVKNALLLLALWILIRLAKADRGLVSNILALAVGLLFIAAPFVVFPTHGKVVLPLSKLATSPAPSSHEAPGKGKHVLCLMSLTCSHCRDAAIRITEINQKNPNLPFYFIFPYWEADSSHLNDKLADFMQETGAYNIPYAFAPSATFVDFVKAAGETGVPVILWMRDSAIVRKLTPPELNQKEIEQWLQQ